MKVRQLVEGWPLSRWLAGRFPGSDSLTLESDPGMLRLFDFTDPDIKGCFGVTALDFDGRAWANSFCVDQLKLRTGFNLVLVDNIGMSLADIGEIHISLPRGIQNPGTVAAAAEIQ